MTVAEITNASLVTQGPVSQRIAREDELLSALAAAERDQLADLLRALLGDLTARTGQADRPNY